MPNIIHNLAALLNKDTSSQVSEGAVLQFNAGYQVRLLSTLPDAEGMVTVQGFPQRVKPESVGLYFRPASVSMELTEVEAAPIIDYYQRQASGESPGFPQPVGSLPPPGNPPPSSSMPPQSQSPSATFQPVQNP